MLSTLHHLVSERSVRSLSRYTGSGPSSAVVPCIVSGPKQRHQRVVPLKNYFTPITSSSMRAVVDRHRLAAHHNRHYLQAFWGTNIHDLVRTWILIIGVSGDFFAISDCHTHFKSEGLLKSTFNVENFICMLSGLSPVISMQFTQWRNWKLLCSVLHTYSVTWRQRLGILGRYGAIEIVLLLLLLIASKSLEIDQTTCIWNFNSASFDPLGSRSLPYECIKFENVQFLLLSTNLARDL